MSVSRCHLALVPSSPVLGMMLNIHDSCYPQVVESPGDRIKMVEQSVRVNMVHVDGEPSTLNRALALVSSCAIGCSRWPCHMLSLCGSPAGGR